MALETLKGVTELGGFKVVNMGALKELFPDQFNPDSGQMNYKWFEAEIRPHNFIYVRDDVNSLSFTIQNGPVKEHGVNGCQVDTIIHAALAIISGLNDYFPSQYNADCMHHLEGAIHALEQRTKDREKRGVEGINQA